MAIFGSIVAVANFAVPVIFSGWISGDFNTPEGIFLPISSLSSLVLGPVGPVLIGSLEVLSKTTSSYALLSIIALLLVPSIFLLTGVLNFIWVTEIWLCTQLKQTESGNMTNVAIRASAELLDDSLGAISERADDHLNLLNWEKTPTISFVLVLLSCFILTIAAGVSALFTGFEEAPGSFLIGIFLTIQVVYIWASENHSTFSQELESNFRRLIGVVFLLFSLRILYTTLQKAI
ncbi:hypothetical protein [Halobacterium noricense]|uniref:hypothetical protein n=1 Tax=Halobacterium noricense TaxID=223182 RepID=UPI001E4A0440|nr:hypothetical protein [Halobacterium noricense]UHH26464.1 hypothetical protein LT974_05880 [Halobacterium noricense]